MPRDRRAASRELAIRFDVPTPHLIAGRVATVLDVLDAIPEREVLSRYPYALATYGELHASLGNLDVARSYLDRAIACQSFAAQVALLRRKRRALER
jgi:predicted RNA polymerase sigma factor